MDKDIMHNCMHIVQQDDCCDCSVGIVKEDISLMHVQDKGMSEQLGSSALWQAQLHSAYARQLMAETDQLGQLCQYIAEVMESCHAYMVENVSL